MFKRKEKEKLFIKITSKITLNKRIYRSGLQHTAHVSFRIEDNVSKEKSWSIDREPVREKVEKLGITVDDYLQIQTGFTENYTAKNFAEFFTGTTREEAIDKVLIYIEQIKSLAQMNFGETETVELGTIFELSES